MYVNAEKEEEQRLESTLHFYMLPSAAAVAAAVLDNKTTLCIEIRRCM